MRHKPIPPRRSTTVIFKSTRRHLSTASMHNTYKSSRRSRRGRTKVGLRGARHHHNKTDQGSPGTVHESSKRPKLEPGRLRHESSSSSIPGGPHSTGSNGSGSERLQGSEPPPTRKERVNSSASMASSHYSSNGLPHLSQRNSLDDSVTSPLIGHMESSPRSHYPRNQPPPLWKEASKPDGTGRQPLPPLSDMLDDGKMAGLRMSTPSDSSFGPGFVAANHPRGVPMHSNGRVPYLRHEPSSTGSSGSSGSVSSVSSFARTPGEGPVPIYALLADRSTTAPSQASTPPSSAGMASPTEPSKGSYMGTPGPRGYGNYLRSVQPRLGVWN